MVNVDFLSLLGLVRITEVKAYFALAGDFIFVSFHTLFIEITSADRENVMSPTSLSVTGNGNMLLLQK